MNLDTPHCDEGEHTAIVDGCLTSKSQRTILASSSEDAHSFSTIPAPEKSTCDFFPPEILAAIFNYAAPPIDFERPEYPTHSGPRHWAGHKKYSRIHFLLSTLAAVSSYWRKVVNSTPELWTSFAVRPIPSNLKEKLELLDLCFKRSGNLCVDLKIRYNGFRFHYSNSTPEFLKLFAANTHRVKGICLRDPPVDLANSFDELFVRLEYLRLKWSPKYAPGDFQFSTNTPSLRRIFLQYPTQIDLRGVALTSLSLAVTPIDLCVKLLLHGQCPNLTEYYCRSPVPSPYVNISFLRFPEFVTFPRMTKFGWTCMARFKDWDDILFDRLRLPALQTLCWFGGCIGLSHDRPYPTFFAQFFNTVTTLYLEGISQDWHLLECIINRPVNPQHVILKDCPTDCLTYLIYELNPDDRPPRPVLFPRLEDILCAHEAGYVPQNELPDSFLGGKLVDVLERRRSTIQNIPTFRITFMDWTKFVWLEEVVERIKKMKREGFSVEVYEDRRLLQW